MSSQPDSLVSKIASMQNRKLYQELHWEGSFEDYLDCRKMHLVVTLFHNDGVFGSLLKLLRRNKISVWRCWAG